MGGPGRALERWNKKDNKARAIIGLSLEKDQLVHVRDKVTAIETWNSLKTIHEKDTLTNKISLYKKIAQLRLKNSDSIENHVNQLLDMFQKLENLGAMVDDQWKIGMILASLPKSFSTLVTALEARKEEELTLSLVQMKILDEHQRQQECKNDEYETTDQMVYEIRKEKVFCYFCKKDNHRMENCFRLKQYNQFKEFEAYLKNKYKTNNEKDSKEEINALNINDDTKDDDYMVLGISVENQSNECKIGKTDNKSKGENKLSKVVKLYQQIHSFKIENEDNLANRINYLNQLFLKIEHLDSELTDTYKSAILLNSLPTMFLNIILKFETTENLSWDEVKKKILKEDKIIKGKERSSKKKCNESRNGYKTSRQNYL